MSEMAYLRRQEDQFESPKLWVFLVFEILHPQRRRPRRGENWWRNYHGLGFFPSYLNTPLPPAAARQFSHSSSSDSSCGLRRRVVELLLQLFIDLVGIIGLKTFEFTYSPLQQSQYQSTPQFFQTWKITKIRFLTWKFKPTLLGILVIFKPRSCEKFRLLLCIDESSLKKSDRQVNERLPKKGIKKENENFRWTVYLLLLLLSFFWCIQTKVIKDEKRGFLARG